MAKLGIHAFPQEALKQQEEGAGRRNLMASSRERAEVWINQVTKTDHNFRDKTFTEETGSVENGNYPLSEEKRHLLRCYVKLMKYSFV